MKRFLGRAPLARDQAAKIQGLRRCRFDIEIAEETVEGHRKPVTGPLTIGTHLEAAAQGQVVSDAGDFLVEGGELGLPLGIGAVDDQAELAVEDAEVGLAVEIKLA